MKSFGIQIVAAIGNVQVYFMTVLYTRWSFNTEHETNFAYSSKIMKDSLNFVYIQAMLCRTPYILMKKISHEIKNSNFDWSDSTYAL